MPRKSDEGRSKGRGRASTAKVRKRPRSKRGPTKRRGTLKRPGRLLAHGCAFTSEIVEAILGAVEAGRSRKYAAAQVGIGERTLQRWVERGRQNLEVVDATAEDDAPVEVDAFGMFVQRLIQGEAYARGKQLDRIDKAGAKDWHAAAWLLERSDHREFGRHHRVEGVVTDENGEETSAADLLFDKLMQIKERERRFNATPEGDELEPEAEASDRPDDEDDEA